MEELRPRLRTTIIGEGTVAQHDVTRKGLHRLQVECIGKYPTLEVWSSMLPKEARQIACWTDERNDPITGFTGVLWIYYKIGR